MKPQNGGPQRRVFDLHADLLSYLTAETGRSPLQSTSRVGLHQLRDGGVDLQVLPIFALGSAGSAERGLAQARAYHKLVTDYKAHYVAVDTSESVDAILEGPAPGRGRVGVIAAIENAASACEACEPLATGFCRLDEIIRITGRLLYVGLTWRGENRFGGGDAVPDVGLKDDGRALLTRLSGRDIAVDLSHASDRLADDILNEIERRGLALIPIASHSNFRSIRPHARNLPDRLATAIVASGGIIGLNLVRGYVGERPEALARHLGHGIERGWGEHLALGTDFFWEGDLPSRRTRSAHHFFFPGFENAACHPQLQSIFADTLGLGDDTLSAITSRNVARFLTRLWGGHPAATSGTARTP